MSTVDLLYNMHPEPYPGYKFNVYIQALFMSFSKISHLEDGIETDAFVEGGLNHHVHSLFRPVARERQVVFERGMAFRGVGTQLWSSRFHVGQRLNTDIVVAINDRGGQLRDLLLLHGAVVKNWSCSDLDAMNSAILLERFVLAYETLESFPTAAGLMGEMGIPGQVSIPNSREITSAQAQQQRRQEAQQQRAERERREPGQERTQSTDAQTAEIRERRDAQKQADEARAAQREALAKERAERIEEIRRKRAGNAVM